MASSNFYAKLVKNQWQLFPNNQSGVVFWNTPDVVFDHGGMYSTSISGYRIPVGGDGTYLVSFRGQLSNTGTNQDVFKVEIVHADENLNTKRTVANSAFSHFGYGTSSCGTALISYAKEKDIFYTRVYHNCGSTGVLTNNPYVLNNINSSFEIVRIKQ